MSTYDPDTMRALRDVKDELERQHEKWGPQDHPNGTGPDADVPATYEIMTWAEGDTWAPASGVLRSVRLENDRAVAGQRLTWLLILLEEVFEAAVESDPEKLSIELNQVAAVAVQWRLAIQRNGSSK